VCVCVCELGKPVIVKAPVDSELQVGQTLRLHCDVSSAASRSRVSVWWLHNARPALQQHVNGSLA